MAGERAATSAPRLAGAVWLMRPGNAILRATSPAAGVLIATSDSLCCPPLSSGTTP